jgi:ADP-dependent NAD(P)H-hydrate dehydratase / NAD(P)H-hydrate epimerase
MTMLNAITAARMRRADRLTISRYGIPVLLLMENAGRAVAEATRALLKKKRGRRVIVLCGSGHNGGDGVVAARYLHNGGYGVEVWWIKNPGRWQGDIALHYRMAKRLGVRFRAFVSLSPVLRRRRLRRAAVLVDALLGTGTRGEIRGLYREAIEAIRHARRPVVAVDIPSGLDADSGRPLGIAVQADVTVTMAAPKIGLAKPIARPYVGQLVVADIGIPQALLHR